MYVEVRLTFEPPHDKINKMTVRPAKLQISLGIRPLRSASSLCALWVAKDPSFLHADSEDSGQTGRMPRLVFAGRTYHFVGFVMRRLIDPIKPKLLVRILNVLWNAARSGFLIRMKWSNQLQDLCSWCMLMIFSIWNRFPSTDLGSRTYKTVSEPYSDWWWVWTLGKLGVL